MCYLYIILLLVLLFVMLLLCVVLFFVEGNPSGIKEALYFKGICSSYQVRLPLRPLSKENSNKLKSVLKDTI